jgi:hypothetical protein
VTAYARARPSPQTPQNVSKVSARVTPERSGQVRPFPRPVQSIFNYFSREYRAIVIQCPGGVGRKMGPNAPAGQPARRRDHIWGKVGTSATHSLDERRRAGFLLIGPLGCERSRFTSPNREWDWPDERATSTAICLTNQRSRYGTAQAPGTEGGAAGGRGVTRGHGISPSDSSSRLRVSAGVKLDALPRVSRNTIAPCHPFAVVCTYHRRMVSTFYTAAAAIAA